MSGDRRKLILVRGHKMTKRAGLLGLAFPNENPEVVLIPNSDCSHCSGLKLKFVG